VFVVCLTSSLFFVSFLFFCVCSLHVLHTNNKLAHTTNTNRLFVRSMSSTQTTNSHTTNTHSSCTDSLFSTQPFSKMSAEPPTAWADLHTEDDLTVCCVVCCVLCVCFCSNDVLCCVLCVVLCVVFVRTVCCVVCCVVVCCVVCLFLF